MNRETERAEASAKEAAGRRGLRRRLEARRLLRAETFYFVGLAAFAGLTALAYYHAYFGWDLRVARALHSLDTPRLMEFMRLVSVPGDRWFPFALTGATMLVFLVLRRMSEAMTLLLSAGGSAILNKLLKVWIGRPRPAADLVGMLYSHDESSFPSGHVTFFVGYFGFLFFVAFALLPRNTWRRRLALVLLGAAVVLIGLSRVYLRAHWPSDVLGAYLSGGLWLAFSVEVYRRWKARARAAGGAAATSDERPT
ncbi:MAG TPA: phosphatase PAP2 family protein [Pyrinomonadaceae bacterium]|nr:phosphatase PAP2 family protein [Pyrinomonadaceae bacterium]